jgi:hypothetical protein
VARSAPSACRPVTGSWSGRGTGHPSARSLTSCGPIPTTRGRSWRPTSGPPTTSPASTPLTGSRSCPSGGRRRRARCRCAPVRSRSTWRRAAGDASPCPGRGGSPGGSRARRPTAHGRRGPRHQPARNRGVVPGQGLALDPRRLRPHRGRGPRKARPRPTPAARVGFSEPHPDPTSPTSPCGSGAHGPARATAPSTGGPERPSQATR